MTTTRSGSVAGAVRSTDGTSIAYERRGRGPVLVLVDSAGGYRDFNAQTSLAEALADRFTVVSYDRRGRGRSTDTRPYAVRREVEDLAAVIDAVIAAAGTTTVFAHGASSGALLCLQAAATGVPVRRLSLWEPPIGDDADRAAGEALRARLDALVAAGRRGEAVDVFLGSIGVPAEVLVGMGPARRALDAVAHTLGYDCAVCNETTYALVRRVRTPALVLDSGGSSDDLTGWAASVAAALPCGSHRSLDGGWHGVSDEVLAPAVTEFFLADLDEDC